MSGRQLLPPSKSIILLTLISKLITERTARPATIAAIAIISCLGGGLPAGAFAGITISISPEVFERSETRIYGLAKITATATLNPCSKPQIPNVLNCKLKDAGDNTVFFADNIPFSGYIPKPNADGTQVVITPSTGAMLGLMASDLGYHSVGIELGDIYGNKESATTTYLVVNNTLPSPTISASCVDDNLRLSLQSTVTATPEAKAHYYILYSSDIRINTFTDWRNFDFITSDSIKDITLESAKQGIWYQALVCSMLGYQEGKCSDFTDPVQSFCPVAPPLTSGSAVGVFRNGQWFLDANGNGAWDGCGTEFCFTGFGQAGDMPASGNWDGGSKSYIGVLRSGTGEWFVDLNGNRKWDGCVADGCYVGFGAPGDLPVAGDWHGTGFAKIGVFRNGQWFLDATGDGKWDGCSADLCLSFGQALDLPVAGNWNGGVPAGVGVFRAGTWYLDYNGNGKWDGCQQDGGQDVCLYGSFGQAG
ncbi:MAG TPA: hypothetical protein PLD53_05440, partial [Candidatus Propionivibrio aalborgensis]|nr:hypothetical protein [Candidatus Propionivibrio aalborgensis]